MSPLYKVEKGSLICAPVQRPVLPWGEEGITDSNEPRREFPETQNGADTDTLGQRSPARLGSSALRKELRVDRQLTAPSNDRAVLSA